MARAVCAASAPRLCFGSRQRTSRLRLVFQKQHFVNDGDFVRELDFHERAADRFADVRGVNRLAAQNHAETNDGRKRGLRFHA